jgi:hypothetical protein
MLNVLLLSSPLLTVVAGQMSQSECVRLASYCTGNQTVKPMQILPNDQLCAANVTAYCDDTCAKMAPYKACMEPLRTDCFRYGGPNALLMQMDRLCNSSEPLCTGCCATGASKPVVKTPAQLTCEERQEYCDDLVSSLGTTAGCQGCVKFSLTVACRSADAKCAADDNWKAVTDVTLRGCAQLKGFCGDCCGLDVTVNSTCGPGHAAAHFCRHQVRHHRCRCHHDHVAFAGRHHGQHCLWCVDVSRVQWHWCKYWCKCKCKCGCHGLFHCTVVLAGLAVVGRWWSCSNSSPCTRGQSAQVAMLVQQSWCRSTQINA